MTQLKHSQAVPMPTAREPKKKAASGSFTERYASVLLAAAILLAWQFAVPLLGLSEFVLPTPLAIGKRMVTDFDLLAAHSYITLLEVLAGFLAGVLIGIPLALAIFYSKAFERAVYPLLVALQTVPKIALAPLLVLYLGYGWWPKISLAFLISFFPIVISTVVGLQSLDKGLVNMVRSMGSSEWQTFFKVRLPAALPSIFGGLKVAISLAVIGAIIGEYIAAERGLGYLQLQANSQFDTTLNFATVVTISLLGVLLYFVLALIESKVSYQRESAK
ncbi:ABC transporter permease [Variovorax sp. LjRoot175]|uniref:ABC transporter permease n=1 Tax=Variovorax sp. LjRoot175 TaxID=3342276 RepID=UPI003ECD058C